MCIAALPRALMHEEGHILLRVLCTLLCMHALVVRQDHTSYECDPYRTTTAVLLIHVLNTRQHGTGTTRGTTPNLALYEYRYWYDDNPRNISSILYDLVATYTRGTILQFLYEAEVKMICG